MKNTQTVFGFGSLISTPSLLATAPNASDIRQAYIKGFIRSFNFWDAVGYTETNLDVANEPMCALDIAETTDAEARVNGVAFNVSESDLSKLLKREEGYGIISVIAYDYGSDQQIAQDCLVFSANKNNGTYAFGGNAQQRYLEDYLKAAKKYGEQFYQELLDTTFINNQPLREIVYLSNF
jgi:cation transport regulator ChaC